VRKIVKDPFILDFLAADPIRERDLSKALTDNPTRFLRELGTGFAFVGVEVPIQCGDREFFVDLLFYHYRLHRFVVFELKIGRFEPEYVGKLNFYVQLVDDHLRDQALDDPTLGMLLVVGRDDVTVEVALRGVKTPLAVTEWRRLPANVRRALPTAEALSATVTRTVREIESSTVAPLGSRKNCSSAGKTPSSCPDFAGPVASDHYGQASAGDARRAASSQVVAPSRTANVIICFFGGSI
jgi:hypothetical protein